jgi:hypothetical protein
VNFEKYSKQQFESRGLSTPSSRKLADELQGDVTEEIQAAVLAAVRNVVEGLNACGHDLKPYGKIRAGDISFRDEPSEGQCHLRLACDFTISAGYAHTLTEAEEDNPI